MRTPLRSMFVDAAAVLVVIASIAVVTALVRQH